MYSMSLRLADLSVHELTVFYVKLNILPPRNKKHSIDAVVDRLKVAKGIEQRLAESFETAVQMAEGIAVVSKSMMK